jgi:hypothetical protein
VVAVFAPIGQAVAMLADRPGMETDLKARGFARAGGGGGAGACGDGKGGVEEAAFFLLPS